MSKADPETGLLEVLANERAGLRGAAAREIGEQLARAGVNARMRPVAPEDLEGALREVVARSEVVAVCGGDGTLLAAAEVLAGGPGALVPVPTGTLNHFARRVGVESVADAANALLAGRWEDVPVGIVDDRVFLNTATFGLYADVVRQRERLRPWFTKWPAATLALVARLIRMRRLQVTLEVQGERLERFTPLVWVGVGWGSFPRVHQAPERRGEPDLEIVVLRPRGRFGVVGLSFRFLRHLMRRDRPVQDPALEVIHARSLLIHSAERIGVTMDGEVRRLEGPVFIGVVDRALRVAVGEAEDSSPPPQA
jgi:diacylglycerol kinase family enzyme